MQTDKIYFAYGSQDGELFKIALKTGILTMITLGIYRFWAKSRIRRHIWSSASIGEDRFEYHGTGLEKFLGFLIAIVVLAIYLGLVQLILIYFGLNLFQMTDDPAQVFAQTAAIYLNLLAVLPLAAFATYRARRYKLARTSWRGIRFGMDNGAWGYVWRYLFYSLLTLVSLGALMPLATFRLEKYMADRSFVGDAPIAQNGKWAELYPSMKYIFFGVLCVLGAVVIAFGAIKIGIIAGFLGCIVLVCGLVHYNVQSFAYLMTHKTLNKTVGFSATPRTKRILATYILGGIVVGLITGIFGAVFGGISFTLFSVGNASTLGFLFTGLTYLGFFVLANALSLIMITQPILEHMFSSITVHNSSDLEKIFQTVRRSPADAEGFADALDIGGAF
ncbi:DUF898 family protein [Rhodobacteraceae bacterium Araon29]